MRALLFAFLLAIATAVPAFADGDGGGDYRPHDPTPAATVDSWDGAR